MKELIIVVHLGSCVAHIVTPTEALVELEYLQYEMPTINIGY
jgi:hypothetical protein